MNIYTYYDDIEDYGDKRKSNYSKMIEEWKKSWGANGWNPIVLYKKDVEQHPYYQEYITKIKKSISKKQNLNNNSYEIACFVRWLAVSNKGGGFMCDYDVLNNGLKPPKEYPEKLTCYQNFVPALMSGSAKSFLHACKIFATCDPITAGKFIERDESGKPMEKHNFSDMLGVKNIFTEKELIKKEKVINFNKLLKNPSLKNKYLAVHFSSGSFSSDSNARLFAMQEFNQNKTIKNKTDPDLTPITVNEFTYLNEQGDYLIKNNSAEKNILILGSCRVIHHLNAFLRIKEFGDNYNYVVIRTQKGLNEKIQENIFSDPCLVGLIKNSDIFIHEYVINFEYLNTDPDCEKNIYKVKKDFEKDITLPNLPLLLMTLDLMLLYHEEFREKYKKYIRNMDKYYNDLVKDASLIRDGSVEKYCEICDKCDLSSLGNWFRDNYQKKRMFYNSNHPSNELQYKVLQSVLEKHWPTKKFDLSRVEKLFTHRELLINPRRSYSDFDVKELGYVYAQNEAMPLEKLNRAVHGIPTYFLEKINDLDLDDIIAVFTDDKPRDALISADGEKASHLQIINNNKIIEVIENPKEINEIINLLKEKKVGSVAFADVSKETVQAFGRAGMKSYSIGGSVNEYL